MKEWLPIRLFDADRLSKNVEALKIHRPDLFQRIQTHLESDAVLLRISESGFVECAAVENGETTVLVTADSVESALPSMQTALRSFAPLSETGLLFAIGWDVGYGFERLYRLHLKEAVWKIGVAVEPDPRLFAASMAVHSFSEAIQEKRLFFVLGEDWSERLARLISDQHFFALSRIEAFSGCPIDAPIYQTLRQQVRAIAERTLKQSRETFERDMGAAVEYYRQKPPDRLETILAIDWSGGMAVSYIHKRFLDECAAQGMKAVYHKAGALGGIGFIHAIIKERPDLLVMVNFAPEKHAPVNLLNHFRLPRMVWFLDDPHNFINTSVRFGQHDFLFSWDTTYAPFLQSHGALSVDHFPYVADLDRATPTIRDEFRAPIGYIGQVCYLVPEEHGLDRATGELVKKAGLQKSLEPHRSYQSLVLEHQKEFGLNLIQSEEEPLARNVSYAIYIVGNALLRLRVLERVAPFGLKLYGNEDWLKVAGDGPLRDCYCGPADPTRDVPDIFVSSQINLNIHSLHARSSLNQRDFNCPLVGGFLLADWVEGADAFFEPDREAIFYHDLDDLENKIRFYLENPGERDEIIRRGKERVLREHVYARRVPRVLETLKGRIRERYLD